MGCRSMLSSKDRERSGMSISRTASVPTASVSRSAVTLERCSQTDPSSAPILRAERTCFREASCRSLEKSDHAPTRTR